MTNARRLQLPTLLGFADRVSRLASHWATCAGIF